MPAQRAEDQTPFTRFPSCSERFPTVGEQGVVVVGFVCEALGVWVVTVSWERRVVDHGAFEVEAAVAEVEDEVDVLLFG